MKAREKVPIISIVGWGNSGKTTFLTKLVGELKAMDYQVGIIKHHHGSFETDQPGKDTWRLFQAGADCTAISGPDKVGLTLRVQEELTPGELAAMMPNMDLIITEGYKGAPYPQIEVRRSGDIDIAERDVKPGLKPTAEPAAVIEQLMAVVGESYPAAAHVPCFGLNDAAGVARLIAEKLATRN